MSNDLRTRIRTLRTTERGVRPDAAWVRRTRETLLMQVRNTLPTEELGRAQRMRELFRTFVSERLARLVRTPVMAVLSSIAVVTGGSILSVSAAERSLPGDFFYGLKLVTEQARLALTSAKEDRLILKSEFTERRVDELGKISDNPGQKGRVVEVTEMLKRDLDTMKQQLTDVKQAAPADKAVAAAKIVDKKTQKMISDLQATKEKLPLESKEKVTEAQSVAAEASVKAIEVLAEKHQESSEIVPAEEVVQAIQDHTKVVIEVTKITLPPPGASTSTASGTVAILLPDVLATSTAISTSSLPAVVSEVKDLTTQAFAMQIAEDQMASASSSSATLASDSATSTGSTSSTTPTDGSGSGTSTSSGTSSSSPGTSPP